MYQWRINCKDLCLHDAVQSMQDMQTSVQSLEKNLLAKQEDVNAKDALVHGLKQKIDYLSERLEVILYLIIVSICSSPY